MNIHRQLRITDHGFEGLGDNTPFWNITTGLVMFLGRYFSLITMLAVAASLKEKR